MTAVLPAPRRVSVEGDNRLAQLLAQYNLAKLEADKAADALKAITDGIKLEMASLVAEDEERLDVEAPGLERPLRMAYTETWRIDSTKLKADDPETWVRYAKKSASWGLREVSR